MKDACKECAVRKFYGNAFDSEDCWYNCLEKENKERTEDDLKELWDRMSSY